MGINDLILHILAFIVMPYTLTALYACDKYCISIGLSATCAPLIMNY